MEIKMNFNDFIKIKSIVKIIDISGEISDHHIKDNELNGILCVSGKYAKEDLENNLSFSEEIPFSFIFPRNLAIINDVDCINLDYELVEGRGIELAFEIHVDYELEKEEEIIENQTNEEIIDTARSIETEESDAKKETNIDIFSEDKEEIKDEITENVNQKLIKTLSTKEDNLPPEDKVFEGIKEEKSVLRVCYFSDDAELEKVCKKNNLSLNQVFTENKNFNINETRRIIINE